MDTSMRGKGIFLALFGSILWGASGIAGQFLMQDRGVSPEWLAAVRMIAAGILLLALDGARHKGDIFSIWKERRNAAALLLFSVIGMLGVQYMYFAAIVESNAPTATILQYIMPILIIGWTAFQERRIPSGRDMLCAALAVGGTVLLVTRGSWGAMAISPAALAWGLGSAVAAAFYVTQPKRLIRQWRSSLVVGWGMFAGGLAFSPIACPWALAGRFDTAALLALAFVVVFGTAAAFWLYLSSVEYIEPSEAGLLNSAEPLSSILFSVFLLGLSFGAAEWAGAAMVILAVLGVSGRKQENAGHGRR